MAISSECAGLPVSPTLPYLRVSKVCLMHPGRTVGPSYILGRLDLFLSCPLSSFHNHSSLLTFYLCYFVLFHSCCSHARVFRKSVMHEFISYNHIEWYLFFSDSATTSVQCVFGAKSRNTCTCKPEPQN